METGLWETLGKHFFNGKLMAVKNVMVDLQWKNLFLVMLYPVGYKVWIMLKEIMRS